MCNKGCKHIGQRVIQQDNVPEGVLHQLQGCLSSNTRLRRNVLLHQILWWHRHHWQTSPGLLPTRNPGWLWKLSYCWGNVARDGLKRGIREAKTAYKRKIEHHREFSTSPITRPLVPPSLDPNDLRWPHLIHQSAPASWCTLRAMNPRTPVDLMEWQGGPQRPTQISWSSTNHCPNPSSHSATIIKLPRKTTIGSLNNYGPVSLTLLAIKCVEKQSNTTLDCLHPHWTHFSLHTELLHQQRMLLSQCFTLPSLALTVLIVKFLDIRLSVTTCCRMFADILHLLVGHKLYNVAQNSTRDY